MRLAQHRPGLSFEAAPPRRSHPNRTDIACFVGCVARRSAAQPRRLIPEVLARWVETQPAFRAVLRDANRLRRATVQLDSPAAFRQSLQAALDTSAWPDVVDADAFERLLRACRELTSVPAGVVASLAALDFVPGSLLGRAAAGAGAVAASRATLDGWTRVQRLVNLPVRCESFDSFAELFAWERRDVNPPGEDAPRQWFVTPLGAAVRAFFAGGGRTCHVVVTGAPVALFDGVAARYGALAAEERESIVDAGDTRPGDFDLALRVPVLPGAPAHLPAAPIAPGPVTTDPARWRGIEHVFGLGDVSFVALPDLVDAIAAPLPRVVPRAETLTTPELFQECAERPAPARLPVGRRLPAPTLGAPELDAWRHLITFTRLLLDNQAHPFNRRDAQLLASLPLAADEPGLPKQGDWAAWLATEPAVESDRIQLAWPWLRTRESADCQGGIEAPEGALAGVLSASALRSGSYRSAARFAVDRLVDIVPRLDLGRATSETAPTALGEFTLADRVCLIAPTPRGPELLSDVTLAADPLMRAGAVRRLLNVVHAQARMIGEELVFEPNGEQLWSDIVDRLRRFGQLLVSAGALSSDAGEDAFVARCGRTTMTQNDIDAGRALVEVTLVPAQPIVRIVIVMDLRDATLSTRGAGSPAQAA